MTVYPSNWHDFYGDQTGHSANTIVSHVLSLFPTKSAIEVGCGNAHWMAACVAQGVADYLVTDGPWNDRAGLIVDQDRFLEVNLDHPPKLGRHFDLAICLEVAEHVDGEYADNVVTFLTEAADIVLFGAAIPFQGGYGHINEQWPSYWRARFEALGYEPFDLVRTKFWSDRSIHYWYRQNTFVYIRRERHKEIELARQVERDLYMTKPLFDAAHPEKFEEMASYEAIAFKRLVKRLPGWLMHRLKSRLRLG